MKISLDLPTLSLRTFLTTRLLFAALPLGPETWIVLYFLAPFHTVWFEILFSFYSLWGPLYWESLGAPAVSQGMSLLLFLSMGRLQGSFLEWRRQPGSTSCASPITCCVVLPKAYLRRPLNPFWPDIFLALWELGWIPVFSFHFQGMPTLLICVPGLHFLLVFLPPLHPPALWSMDTVIRIGN